MHGKRGTAHKAKKNELQEETEGRAAPARGPFSGRLDLASRGGLDCVESAGRGRKEVVESWDVEPLEGRQEKGLVCEDRR